MSSYRWKDYVTFSEALYDIRAICSWDPLPLFNFPQTLTSTKLVNLTYQTGQPDHCRSTYGAF